MLLAVSIAIDNETPFTCFMTASLSVSMLRCAAAGGMYTAPSCGAGKTGTLEVGWGATGIPVGCGETSVYPVLTILSTF